MVLTKHLRTPRSLSCWFGLCLLLTLPPVFAKNYVLKFATLAPPGSTWMNLMEDWAQEVDNKTQGQLTFKFYPGGVQGDEPDVLRKIRFGQLQGAALTGYGIGHIYPPARIMEFPFLFDPDYQEIDVIRNKLMPDIEAGFSDNGYQLLGWMEVGFIHFFSTKPIHSFADLRQQRIWLWQGDPLGEAMFRASGLAPVPLSITDVFTSLSTGLVDTVYCTPLAAIALQWFTKVHYMTNLPMANAIGGLVVSNRFFQQLPPHLQQVLRETGQTASDKLISATRADNEASLAILKDEGISFLFDPEDVSETELAEMRDKALSMVVKHNYIPGEWVERVESLLLEYRSRSETLVEKDTGRP